MCGHCGCGEPDHEHEHEHADGTRHSHSHTHSHTHAPTTLVELQTEEPRPPEAFWLGWKNSAMGEALKWWVKQLNRQLVPALLPKSV